MSNYLSLFRFTSVMHKDGKVQYSSNCRFCYYYIHYSFCEFLIPAFGQKPSGIRLKHSLSFIFSTEAVCFKTIFTAVMLVFLHGVAFGWFSHFLNSNCWVELMGWFPPTFCLMTITVASHVYYCLYNLPLDKASKFMYILSLGLNQTNRKFLSITINDVCSHCDKSFFVLFNVRY